MDKSVRTFMSPPGAAAKVSLLNTCFLRQVPTKPYIQPVVPGHDYFSDLPCLVFLVESPSGRKVLFDLGLRKDWQNLSPVALVEVDHDRIEIDIEEDIVDCLRRGGINPSDIEAVVLSHHHWDHVGDLSLFPDETRVVVGPGFVKAFTPGYPNSPTSPLLASDFRNKAVVEVNFDGPTAEDIGPFKGHDFFGDGSFYIINAPGHTLGHICALARTTTNPDTFVLMGADACHHNGEYRPSCFRRIPASVCLGSSATSSPVPGSLFEQYLHLTHETSEKAFFGVVEDPRYVDYIHDISAAKGTISKVQHLDSFDNIFVILAHDDTIGPIVPSFPETINLWKSHGWHEKCRWAFLKDFRGILNTD